MNNKFYKLLPLPYGYNDLAPFLTEEQLQLHHDKHHKKYIDDANALLEKMEMARKEGSEVDVKNIAKGLSFNIGGHILHSLFWSNMTPAGIGSDQPSVELGEVLINEFGSVENFKFEFNKAAISCEGSGWAVLAFDMLIGRPFIMQIEKHNNSLVPGYTPLLVLDVWEHAYYLDYKNDRARYVEGFWDVVNWDVVSSRFDDLGS